MAYEANGHIYIYSTDGIPTLVDSGSGELEKRVNIIERVLDKEITDRKAVDKEIQDELEALKNSPDVVDIVDTYADLMAYDTSTITDKDVIRVLNDEEHDGYSTYYRFDQASDSWDYIGKVDAFIFEEYTFTMLDNTTVTKKFAVFNQGA